MSDLLNKEYLDELEKLTKAEKDTAEVRTVSSDVVLSLIAEVRRLRGLNDFLRDVAEKNGDAGIKYVDQQLKVKALNKQLVEARGVIKFYNAVDVDTRVHARAYLEKYPSISSEGK
jgi:hypothetical protein